MNRTRVRHDAGLAPGGRRTLHFRLTAPVLQVVRERIAAWVERATGHETPAIYQRYAIVDEADLRQAVAKLAAASATLPLHLDSGA